MRTELSVRAVIFDMDGVITDTMPYHMRAWHRIFAEAGIHLSHEDVYKREGQRGIDSVKELFLEHGLLFSEEIALKMLKDKETLFKKIFKRRYIQGSRSLVKKLKGEGFKLALVTGTSRHEAEHLLPHHIWSCFDVTVCGTDVKRGKPHPEPYRTALKKLKIRPEDAVVIENAPFGIRSAKAARIRCLALETSLSKKFLRQADGVFHSYNHLLSSINFIHPNGH